MSIFIIGMMIIGLAAAVAYPFFSSTTREPGSERVDSRDRLEHEKAIALVAIREAELDRAMGKLSEDDYRTLRLQYEERAVQALTALDELKGETSPATGMTDVTTAAKFCARCGHSFQSDERFCPACGRARISIC